MIFEALNLASVMLFGHVVALRLYYDMLSTLPSHYLTQIHTRILEIHGQIALTDPPYELSGKPRKFKIRFLIATLTSQDFFYILLLD